VAAAGTLALGLASAVVAWVLVRDVLLRPLPFPGPDRLVRLREVSDDGRQWWPSFPNAADWREHARFFEGVAIGDVPRVIPVLLEGRAVRVPVSRAARGFFETLGVQPAAGRFFTAGENRAGAPPVAVVSDRFWKRELNAHPPGHVEVAFGTERFTVVGVLPPDFRFLGEAAAWGDPADVWTAMERDANLGSRTSHGYHVVARLRAGMPLQSARAEMNRLAGTLKAQHGSPTQADSVSLTSLHEVATRPAQDPLRLLLYAAAAVLLVSCLNLAAAILAHGLTRTRELSVRLALGATRRDLARHLLIDAAALAIPAALLGITLAAVALRLIQAAVPGTLPRLAEAALDLRAVGVAAGLAGIAACVAGALPALLLSKTTAAVSLRTHAATTSPPAQRRLWTAFVIAQVALTVMLLSGTGLLIRSFLEALAVDVGYEARHVLAVDVALPELRYENPDRRVAFYDDVLERLRGASGVLAAGLTNALPHDWSTYTSGTYHDRAERKVVFAGYRIVDAGYFAAAGIPILQGDARALESGEAMIDRRLANLLWEGAAPAGARVFNGFAKDALAVGGMVGTVREWHQGDDTVGAVYEHFRRRPDRLLAMHVLVRHAGDAALALNSVRASFAAADPMVPVTIEPLAVRASESLQSRRFMLLLTSGFGIAALLLAAAGVYAMVAFAAGRQLREAAIRLALGAMPSTVSRRILLRGLAPAGLGTVAGLVLAVPLALNMQAQLFNVDAGDPTVLGLTIVTIGVAAAGAAIVPARRASRVDPATTLRDE
jgi:predicted permease